MTFKIREKSAALAVLASLLLFAGIIFAKNRSLPKQQPSPSPTPTVREETTTPEAEVKGISVIARQFEFVPSQIRVKQGERVQLRIKSEDVSHGFSVPALGINETIPAGKEVIVEFTAEEKGTYPFACSIYCGADHSDMRGAIIVE